MGRRAKPVAAGTGPHMRALAAALREMKEHSGLTYANLAKRTEELKVRHGAATLSRAAAGTHLPRLKTVKAFALAAADRDSRQAQLRAVERVEALWTATAVERAAPLTTRPVRRQRSTAGLARRLVQLRAQAGQPTLTQLQELSAAAGHRVPRSTLHLILGGRVLPTRDQLAALLAALDAALGPGRAVVRDHWSLLEFRDAVEQRLRPSTPKPAHGCLDDELGKIQYRREQKEAILRKVGKLNDEDGDGEDDEYRLGIPYNPLPPWETMDDDELAAWEHEALTDSPDQNSGNRLAEMARRARC